MSPETITIAGENLKEFLRCSGAVPSRCFRAGTKIPRADSATVTNDEFEDILDRLLEAGIPPTAVAHAFEMDPIEIRARLTDLRVRQYGVAELAEALGNLQWEAFEQAKAMLNGRPLHGAQ